MQTITFHIKMHILNLVKKISQIILLNVLLFSFLMIKGCTRLEELKNLSKDCICPYNVKWVAMFNAIYLSYMSNSKL